MSVDLYIYYQVDLTKLEKWDEEVRALQNALRGYCQQIGYAQKQDNPSTIMETYQGIDDVESFKQVLTAHLQKITLANYLIPSAKTNQFRHEEWFVSRD
ncbi:DUF4936 family protein [Leeia sp. TBRC 13508]|uniref:DUF4936 family protein n=1 Tax=Leeia speluncae TaxID=2884804 RepID=A0ABS8D1Q1_9NEIS|nr:DUF4936 family protein [Leeia speluncae]MCB6182116.1 DUF4936 family protein [Leeia speluncae]